MPGLIPENILEDILGRVNIVEIISGYLPLKRAGRNFKANCPFHHEKTPSFMVSPDRQIYHCFGCGESGNAFKFLMRYERMDFPEAVEALAKKSGVMLPKFSSENKTVSNATTLLYKVNELAQNFYASSLNLPEATAAKSYLLKRSLSTEAISEFKLGFAQDKWDSLIQHLRQKNINLSLIEKAGLVLPKSNGGYYDRFRNRIIFPIFDIKSRVLGFGARVLDNSLPKYINSPETPIYVKGKNLYGLNLSKDAIRDADFVAVVEGYLDFIVPYSHGFKQIVASQGTALTQEQARLLKRYTQNVVMVYDGDKAGEIATLRSLDIFIEEEMDVKVVTMPEGIDPDLFVRRFGVDKFKDTVAGAQGLFDYKLKVLKSRFNYKETEGKAKICVEMLNSIGKVRNAVLKSEYVKKLAQSLDVREDALLQEMKKVKIESNFEKTSLMGEKKASNCNLTEKLLIKLMFEEKELIAKIRDRIEPGDFQDERFSRIVSVMFDLLEQGRPIESNTIINNFDDQELSGIICESLFMPEVGSQEREKIVDDCIRRLKSDKIKLRRQLLHDQIKLAQEQGDEERINSLMEEFQLLIKAR